MRKPKPLPLPHLSTLSPGMYRTAHNEAHAAIERMCDDDPWLARWHAGTVFAGTDFGKVDVRA